MRRVLPVIADTLTLAVFICAGIISVADLFGWIDYTDASKLTLLALALLGTTQIVERHLQLEDIRTNLLRLASIKAQHVTFLASRAELYRSYLEATSNAPHGSEVLVTHFEKLRVPYNMGELREERELYHLWDKRVREGTITVKQIVHVSSQRDIGEVRQRIQKFSGLPNYRCSIIAGLPITPYLDLIVVGDYWALLLLSSDAASFRVSDMGFAFQDKQMIHALQKYFDLLWSKSARSVKSRDRVDESAIDSLEAVLPAEDDDRRTERAQRYALQSTGSTSWETMVPIVATWEKIVALGEPVLLQSANRSLSSFSGHLSMLAAGDIEIEDHGWRYLVDLIRSAQSGITAVSYSGNDEFWDSEAGREIIDASAKALGAGCEVRRVFILTEKERRSNAVQYAIKTHRRVCSYVYVVKAEEVNPGYLESFLIRDNRVLFRSSSENNKWRCRISVNNQTVEDYLSRFDEIRLKAISEGSRD
jgi:hypothetical protein